jgi:hypothetical protein
VRAWSQRLACLEIAAGVPFARSRPLASLTAYPEHDADAPKGRLTTAQTI